MSRKCPLGKKERARLKQFIKDELGLSPRITIRKLKDRLGEYHEDDKQITVVPNLTRATFIHTVLHEAMHGYCFKHGIFKAYHFFTPGDPTHEECVAYFRTATRAELYVDAKAALLAKRFDSTLQYPVHTKDVFQDQFDIEKIKLRKRGYYVE
jgi:hypothetical protein